MKLKYLWLATAVLALILAPRAYASHVSGGSDVKVTIDNNNVDGGTPNPSFDAQNRPSNETTVAISPVASNIVAAGANDYRMGPVFGDVWLGIYLSDDGGATWFNTMVPGFPSDTSPSGLASPLLGLDGSGDPVVRFDAAGNLYVSGIAFNRNFDQPDRPVDNVVYVARYDYTPGTPGGVSTPASAANPPDFTYAGTTIVDRGAVGHAVPPNMPWGFSGDFVDKEWMEVDVNSPETSKCTGNVYISYTSFHGSGNSPIKFSASSDGGATFSNPQIISTGGRAGNPNNQGSDIGIGPDGTIYVAYRTFGYLNADPAAISIVRSTDCGKHWSQPIVVGQITAPQAPGVAFRTPTFAFVAVDDADPQIVYVAYQDFNGSDYDIYVQRSTDGGLTWSAPVMVNDDAAGRHQIFPTIGISNGALHVAWYDFRHSVTGVNEALDVYYACTNCADASYPVFSHNERVTDVSHNGNCLILGGSSAFHGDYIELDGRWDGSQHVVQVAWADNRDVSSCDLDPAPGPGANNTGNRNQNIYSDKLLVGP